jgi:hypothetical protein
MKLWNVWRSRTLSRALPRIAGVNRVLGIDMTDERIRVVELQRRGSLFGFGRVRVRVMRSFTHVLTDSERESDRAVLLKRALEEHDVRSRFAVSSLQSPGVRTLTAVVPNDVSEIDEWIVERREQLLKMPLSDIRTEHVYRVLDVAPEGTRVEIAFVRPDDDTAHRQIVERAGLTLLSLNAGRGDEANLRILAPPLPVPDEYALAAGLALGGLFPELHRTTFSNDQHEVQVRCRLYRLLTRRAVGFVVAALIPLTFIPLLVTSCVHDQLENARTRLQHLEPVKRELSRAKNEIEQLEQYLAGAGTTSRPSHVARSMHTVATALPNGVWLTAFQLQRRPSGVEGTLSGLAHSTEHVADAVKTLGKEFDHVRLLRSGAPLATDTTVPVRSKSEGLVMFQIRVASSR